VSRKVDRLPFGKSEHLERQKQTVKFDFFENRNSALKLQLFVTRVSHAALKPFGPAADEQTLNDTDT
jgi:hypothetical protein